MPLEHQSLKLLHENKRFQIYSAVKTADQKPVILKILVKDGSNDSEVNKLHHEYELAKSIQNNHVVQYLGLKKIADDRWMLIQEDSGGVALNQLLPQAGFELGTFLNIALQIADGLNAIHRQGVIHKAMKTANFIIHPKTYVVKITDFSCASAIQNEMAFPRNFNKIEGTLAYFSPEQTGRMNRKIDYRTDFYSLGVVFYELLSGHLPFSNKKPLELIYDHIAQYPESLHVLKPAIPIMISKIVAKLLMKNAEDRYQSVHGIWEDLKRCQTELTETQTITSFSLGQKDFSEQLQFSDKYYGREKEITRLLQIFEKSALDGESQLLLVTGYSGVGKSQFVHKIQESILLKQGYFVTGKFDQLNRNMAYSTVAQAFRSLIRHLLDEDEVDLQIWREKLLKALEGKGQLLIDIIPELEHLIGSQPVLLEVAPLEAKIRFNLIFQKFIQVFTDSAHPLVVFLDDLQWADEASLEWIKQCTIDRDIPHFLLIGAYRDNEIYKGTPLYLTLEAIQSSSSTALQVIHLDPFDEKVIQQWVADVLHTSTEQVKYLAELIFKKTQGNPFFVRVFLQGLFDKKLLFISPDHQWQWDLEKIRYQIAADNVVESMISLIRQLPQNAQDLLAIMSCSGQTVNATLLANMSKLSQASRDQALRLIFNKEIAYQIDETIYFSHDRVQEAAYSLLGEQMKKITHAAIARLLLKVYTDHPTQDCFFKMVDHFNLAIEIIEEKSERLKLGEFNLRAARKTKQAVAYTAALTYIKMGLTCYDQNLWWTDHYAYVFALHREQAEIAYALGDSKEVGRVCQQLLYYVKTPIEKAEIYILLINQAAVQTKYQAAIELGLTALGLFGITFPLKERNMLFQTENKQLIDLLQDQPMQRLEKLSEMKDLQQKVIVKLLLVLLPPTYLADRLLYQIITTKVVHLSLQHGLVEGALHGFVTYGHILDNQLGMSALGYTLSQWAVNSCEKYVDLAQKCKVLSTFFILIHHWFRPLSSCRAISDQIFQASFRSGEREYEGYARNHLAMVLFFSGEPLNRFSTNLTRFIELSQKVNNQFSIDGLMCVKQIVDEMQMITPALSLSVFKQDLEQRKNFYALAHLAIIKAQWLNHLGQYTESLACNVEAETLIPYISGQHAVAIHTFYYALNLIALYPTVSPSVQQQSAEQIIRYQQRMMTWFKNCPENFGSKYWLIKAEYARIQSKPDEARDGYEQAIEIAQSQHFIHEAALAHELAGKFYLGRKQETLGQMHLRQAYTAYEQWGATGKMRQLSEHYPAVFHNPVFIKTASSESSSSGFDNLLLNFENVMRASQIISSEMDMEKLLIKIMELIVQTAGARKGTLLLMQSEQLLVQAEYTSSQNITVLQALAIKQWQGPHSLINHVKNTKTSLSSGCAIEDEQFNTDPYVVERKLKSILCLPVMKQSTINGVLYLENNLTLHAFTESHLHVLSILMSQMAISLENARLYEKMQQEIKERRQAEISLRALTERFNLGLNAAQIGIWEWFVEEDRVVWDSNMYQLLGLEPSTVIDNHSATMEFVHPEDREQVEKALKKSITEGVPYDMECRVIRKDKSLRIFSARAKAYRNEKGHITRMLGLNWDITARKQLEAQHLDALRHGKEQEAKRAEEAEMHRKLQEEFVDTLCHELRNPLNGMYGGVTLLSEQVTQLQSVLKDISSTGKLDQIKQWHDILALMQNYIVSIETCAQQQKVIVDDVLDLSKIENTKIGPQRIEFNFNQVIEDTIRMFFALMIQKQLKWNVKLPVETLYIKADPHRLKQVLINLLTNAIKFTDQGVIGVEVITETQEKSRPVLTIRVSDSGAGIVPEKIAHLFDRFVQLDQQATTKHSSSGLGLFISKKLVELMGGTISVKTTKGEGSVFEFTLPYDRAAAEKTVLQGQMTETAKKEETPIVNEIVPVVGKSILIVEDNIVNQKILMTFLKKKNHQVQVANNGVEAIEKYTHFKFDLIFMDIEMPEMNGIEATRRIREKDQTIPIIGLSANARQEQVNQGLEAGMQLYITKPFQAATVYSAIEKFTRKRSFELFSSVSMEAEVESARLPKSTMTFSSNNNSLFFKPITPLPDQTVPRLESVQQNGSEPSQSTQEKNLQKRTGLPDKGNLSSQALMAALPIDSSWNFGKAVDNGDCFYDAIAQALNNLSPNNTNSHTVKSLRKLCADYLYQLDKGQLEDNWVKSAIEKDKGPDNYQAHLATLQYTQEEMAKFKAEINAFTGYAIWGNPSIEGRILAAELKIKLHVIKFHEAEGSMKTLPPAHIVIIGDCVKQVDEAAINYQDKTIIHLAVYRQHFVPILPVQSLTLQFTRA